MRKKFYRVCHKQTFQGLWYDYEGNFTGLIHDDFNFCENSELKMDYDPEIVGWLSAVETIDDLFRWFTKDDIQKLEEYGWFIHEFDAIDFKLYEPFQHIIINQNTSNVIRVIAINDLNNDESVL